MSLKNRILGTILFLIISLGLLEISDKAILFYKNYGFFGHIPPTYTKNQIIDANKEIKKFFIRQDKIHELYQFMKDIDELLCKHNIRYFIDGGTLLGLMRSGGAIPYDDDIDISIFNEDAQKIQSLEKELNQLGYKLILKFPDWYVIASENIALDVFHIKKMGSIYRYANDRARIQWSRFFLYENELFPLQRRKFGDIEVYTPKDPSGYLRRGYGENCMEYAIFSGNHRTGYIGTELKVAIKDVPELQIPAIYTGSLRDRIKDTNQLSIPVYKKGL